MVAHLRRGVEIEQHHLGDVALKVVVAAACDDAVAAAGADDGVVGVVGLDGVGIGRADDPDDGVGVIDGEGGRAADRLGAAVIHVQIDAAARVTQVVERLGTGRCRGQSR